MLRTVSILIVDVGSLAALLIIATLLASSLGSPIFGRPSGVRPPVPGVRLVGSALLPCEPVITRDVLHEEPASAALDELNAESVQAAKQRVGRCDER